MIANFSFDGSVGIRFSGKHYDLHSFFSVAKLALTPLEGNLLLEFSSLDEFAENVHDAKVLRLVFTGIEYVEISPGLCRHSWDTIEEIGFKDPADRDDEWLKPVDQAEPSDHLFIRFSNLEFLRLLCKRARVEVEKTQQESKGQTP